MVLSSSGVNRFVANQATSSAQMVRRMVLDEMRRGDFSHVDARVARIEELVGQGFLRRDEERRLLLLAARFLESNGQTKRAYRFTGTLLADQDTLPQDIFSELRRFMTRLLLNVGQIEDARKEVDRIDRLVLRSDESFGNLRESIDDDDSLVAVPTWLLTAEVCLAEAQPRGAVNALGKALQLMKTSGQCAEDSAMFELLSALACYRCGDDEGIPAIAYLYRVHVVLDSGIESSVRGRIAAAAGDIEHVAGISQSEAQRWRSYGPERGLVAKYLSEGDGVLPPGNLLARMRSAEPQAISEPASEITRLAAPASGIVSTRVEYASVPLVFQFESFGLEEITSMFDLNLKTGPLVIDWSRCQQSLLEEAIVSGAISDVVRLSDRGTIYFNSGAYVDAEFEGIARPEQGREVVDAIFEFFRISMAGLPGLVGYQLTSGGMAARSVEMVNFRPNNLNIDLMKRLDHMRSGVVEPEEEDVDALIDQWMIAPAPATVASAAVSVGIEDREAGMSLVTLVGAIAEAAEVAKIGELARSCFEGLGFDEARLELYVSGCPTSLLDLDGSSERVVVDETSCGMVRACLSLTRVAEINCPEAVRTVLNVCAQRVRTITGRALEMPIESAEFVAEDPVSQTLLSNLRDFAVLDGTSDRRRFRHVLLWGPRGTGKDLLAHLIHKWSNRSEKPFVSVNFGAISKDLAVAELFGAKKGSYTGCVADRRGYVQEAKGGTLFLDELDEATSSVQALVKRAVQFGLFSIVGDSTESQCDARFVAATNISDLDAGAIKRDLKDRFIVLRVPALCERRGDIRPLAIKFAAEYGSVLPEPVLLFLERLDWPGNVRQLQNVVERSCAVVQSEADLTIDLFQSSAAEEGAITKSAEMSDAGVVPLRTGETLEMRLEAEEKRYVIYALTVCEGNRTHAADLLGMSRQWLLGRIKKYDL